MSPLRAILNFTPGPQGPMHVAKNWLQVTNVRCFSQVEAVNIRKHASIRQGCQIFLGSKYQNGENIPNDNKIYQMAINYFNGRKINQMVIKYTNIFHCKTLQTLPKLGFWV
jgi:hypothetical protein